MKKEYAGKEEGPSAIMCIEEDKISLNIQQPDVGIPDEAWETDGWELTPLLQPPTVRRNLFHSGNVLMYLTPQLHRRILDGYKKGKSIPHFELNLKLKEKTNPRTLKQKIGFTGVQESLIILMEPIQEGLSSFLVFMQTYNHLFAGPLPPISGVKEQPTPPLGK